MPAKPKPPTVRDVRRMVEKHGGELADDGVGGYEALAPQGAVWTEADVWCYPLPLAECDSKEERHELIAEAIRMLDGITRRK